MRRNLADLSNCPYCLGVWLALFVALPLARPLGAFVLIWLAIAGGQSALQSLERVE